MIVKLMNWTPEPVRTVLWAYKLMREEVVAPIRELDGNEAVSTVRRLVRDKLGGALEFVSTVWLFDKVSRAFQQQLTRHRQYGYSIQSMRVVDKREFASMEQYLVPDDVKDEALYKGSMLEIQRAYQFLLDRGEEVQVARGILPLNIFSPISMVANMRGLLHMFEQRMCRQVQGEFREVVLEMIKEIRNKMSPVFVGHIAEPCVMTGRCQMSAENELRRQGKDALGRKPCPFYAKVR